MGVDTNSGGPANNLRVGDVNDVHNYPYPQHPDADHGQYAMIGEFGGVGAFVDGKEWWPNKCGTYLHVDTPSEEAQTYINMTLTMLQNQPLSASVYTQIVDVELECDGFLNYDRSSKFSDEDVQAVAKANAALIKKL